MKKYLLLSLSILLVSSCSNSDESSFPTKETHLIFLGLDGCGGYNFEKTLLYMPNVSNYIKEGVYTDKKLAVSPTSSGPNWATMFMGTTPDVHGYMNWDSKVSIVPYSFAVTNNIFPTISQVLRVDKPAAEIGLFCQWEGIKYLVDTLSINHIRHIALSDLSNHKVFTDSVSSYLKSYKPTLCTIVFDDPDHTGHNEGFFSNEYFSVIEELDNCIGKIIQSVKEAGYYDNTVFIITSDHGGNNYSHRGDTPEEKLTCFVMWGKGIKQIGYVDDTLEQQDIAVIMASILGIHIPLVWTGKAHENYFITN